MSEQPQPPRRKLALHDMSSREIVALVGRFLREGQDGLESGLDEFDHPSQPEPQPVPPNSNP